MLPYIDIFGFQLSTYLLLSVVGLGVSFVLAVFLGRQRGIVAEGTAKIFISAIAGTILGGHFLFALTNLPAIINMFSTASFSFQALWDCMKGMVFYGGLFGAIIMVYVYCRLFDDVERADVFDLFAVSAVLFHIFGRVGCFLSGCCYGVESDFGFTMYLNSSPLHFGVSRFPVQLVEAGCNLIIFAVLYIMYKRGAFKGRLIYVYLGAYAVVRFVLEFFRGDEIRGVFLGISTSQLISILIVAFLLVRSTVCILQKKI